MPEIRRIQPNEVDPALRNILDLPGLDRALLEAQVSAFREFLTSVVVPSDAILGLYEGNRLVAAVVCLDSPGKTGLVFAPSMVLRQAHRNEVLTLLRVAADAAKERGMSLLQSLIPPDAAADRRLFGEAGYWRLAELVYLERSVSAGERMAERDAESSLEWTEYSAATHGLFRDVIQQTYEHSLDCPGLAGQRQIEDIMAGHKDTGLFKPSLWFVVHQDSKPAGCLLLAPVKGRTAIEVVYMGVCCWARRAGIGGAMLRKTLHLTAKHGLGCVTLAVDAENSPAVHLYRKFGFSQTLRREAWVTRLSQ